MLRITLFIFCTLITLSSTAYGEERKILEERVASASVYSNFIARSDSLRVLSRELLLRAVNELKDRTDWHKKCPNSHATLTVVPTHFLQDYEDKAH